MTSLRHHQLTHCEDQFDHLVGDGEQRERKGNAEKLSSLEIENQFDLHKLLHW